ncbi:MAG TPA: glucosaminidase domain-containing protein [Bacteroidales bacterium]|nr:glucosaminidase domain-containing protein [Bacteroidales bacterium]
MQKRLYIAISLLLISLTLFSQKTAEQYIVEFADMAVSEMKRSGVPASITLAQGILESASGNSRLAKEGNNHFGIKCHSSWTGAKIYADDDAKNECFRKYKSAEESYRDHSDFLKANSRYHFLFELDKTDYKAWAHGLKKAGYATSPTYAEALIRLIEKHELYAYDSNEKPNIKPDKKPARKTNTDDNFSLNPYGRDIMYNNNTPYIIAKSGDNIESICNEFDMMPWQIRRFNDLRKGDSIVAGEFIYLKPKRNKAEKGHDTHTIAPGENMRDIAQQYAIKEKKLYRKNKMENDSQPEVNTKINLRKTKK